MHQKNPQIGKLRREILEIKAQILELEKQLAEKDPSELFEKKKQKED